jgi:hypothetical protein
VPLYNQDGTTIPPPFSLPQVEHDFDLIPHQATSITGLTFIRWPRYFIFPDLNSLDLDLTTKGCCPSVSTHFSFLFQLWAGHTYHGNDCHSYVSKNPHGRKILWILVLHGSAVALYDSFCDLQSLGSLVPRHGNSIDSFQERGSLSTDYSVPYSPRMSFFRSSFRWAGDSPVW